MAKDISVLTPLAQEGPLLLQFHADKIRNLKFYGDNVSNS